MSVFKDSAGREWSLKINLGNAASLKERAGVNLNDALRKPAVLDEVIGDPAVFFAALTTLVDGQLRDRKISVEDFGASLDDEEVVLGATKAFVEAVIDFFRPDQRRILRKAFASLWSATERKANAQTKAATDKLETMDFDALADQLLSTSTSSSSDEGSAASSGSTSESSAFAN